MPPAILAPANSPAPDSGTTAAIDSQTPSKLPVDFSPPLIAMVVVVATAFLIVTYFRLISRHLLPPFLQLLRRWKRWHRRRRRLRRLSISDIESPDPYGFTFESNEAYRVLSPYGLDETVIKAIPLSVYTAKKKKKGSIIGEEESSRECAVCLLEFEENDYIRTLPACSHAFHVDCIDIWLRSHANCPLCRTGILRPESPFSPMMAARIRPSLDDGIIENVLLDSVTETLPESGTTVPEIRPSAEDQSPGRDQTEDRFNGRDILLKRSYSFGFERNFPSERLVLDPTTVSPWRYRRGNFWGKRPSPFSSLTKHRVFSLRYYRGVKSPFMRRRGFFPVSESSARYGGAGGGSSRRTKSMTSPMFGRAPAAFSSSRLRCGDPEALLSPDRYQRR